MIKHNQNCKVGSQVLLSLSFVALVLTVATSLFQIDLWLAGTQWILVSILLAIYALIFSRGCSDSRCSSDE